MRFLILLLVLLVAGCDNPFGLDISPHIPKNAVRFEPPEVYRELWRQAEAESGMRSDFDSVTWYVVPGYFWEHQGQMVRGLWVVRGRHILVAEDWMNDPRVIRHEILHALGNRGHDHPLFSTPEYNSNIIV